MRIWNFCILLLVYINVQCLASINDPVEDAGIFMEDLCLGVKDHKKLSNPFDKNGYFECVDEKSIEKVCPGKRAFNPTLERCMFDTKSKLITDAKPKQRQMSSIASKYHLLPKPLQKVSTAKTTPRKPRRFIRDVHFYDNEEEPCKGQKNWIKLSYPDDCQKYYLCVNEVAYPHDCPDGDWFEKSRQDCVPPRESQCTRDAPDGYCAGVPNFQKLESPYYCEDYYLCVNDIAYYHRCDNNEWFDQKDQRCDKQENVNCILDTPPAPPEDICEGISNFKYVASPYNCAHYYQCVFERPYFKKCSEDNWFDVEKQTCRYKTEVECHIINK